MARPDQSRDSLRPRFWERVPLAAMTPAEWEALCDGCAKCCLIKLEDADSGTVHYTNIACRLLDRDRCRCTDYARRRRLVPGCVVLSPDSLPEVQDWLPATCAYRRLAEGRGLAAWHPLVSGDPESVHRAGQSLRGRMVAEAMVDPDDLEEYIIEDLH